MEMLCLRCGKMPYGAYAKRCICSPLQKDAYYKSVQKTMRLAAGSKCSYGGLDIIREAVKRKSIKDIHRVWFDRQFPIKPIDSGIIAVKLKAKEGKIFLQKGERKLTKMGGVKNDNR